LSAATGKPAAAARLAFKDVAAQLHILLVTPLVAKAPDEHAATMITTNDAGTAIAARMAAMIAVTKRRVRKAPTSAEANATSTKIVVPSR
jgi:hypothetical protein